MKRRRRRRRRRSKLKHNYRPMFPSLIAISLQPVSTRFMIYVTFPHRCLTDVNVFFYLCVYLLVLGFSILFYYYYFFVPGCAPERGCCVNVNLFKFVCFLFVFSCMRLIKLVFRRRRRRRRRMMKKQKQIRFDHQCFFFFFAQCVSQER